MAKKRSKSKTSKTKKLARKAPKRSPKSVSKKAKKKAKRRLSPKPKRLSKTELLQRKVSSLEKRLRKYEKQRFTGPLLPGKKRKKPSRTELDAIRTRLKLFFEGVKRELEGQDMASKYRSHENADGSIDAELRVPLEDSGDIEGSFIDIEDAGNWNSLSDFWIMIGIIAGSEDGKLTGSPTIDRRPNRAWTNSVRGNRAGAAFFIARETVSKKLAEWGAEFTMIIVRVQWSPDNARLHRPGH